MIRLVVCSAYGGMAANIGGPVEVKYRTFDVSAPELEAFLAEQLDTYSSRHVVGVELKRSYYEQAARNLANATKSTMPLFEVA